jgi:hypothetical protein
VIPKIMLPVLLAFALPAWPQNRVSPPSPGPAWDKGFAEGRTYKNPSIGLQLTAAPGLQWSAPELKGNAGTLPLLVTVAAWGDKKMFAARQGTVFYAEALASYPEDQRSTDAYMLKVVSRNRANGFVPINASFDNFGGLQFERSDFKKGSVYEAALVRACETEALVLFFTDSDLGAVNRLVAATDLKLDLARSGCMVKAHKK